MVWTEQVKAAELTDQRLKHEDENNNDKKIVLSNQIDEYKNEISTLDPQVDQKLSIYKLQKLEFEKIGLRYKKAQEVLDISQTNRWDAQRRMTDDQSLLDRTLSLIEEKRNTNVEMEDKIQEIQSNQERHAEEQKDIETKKLQLEKSSARTQSQLDKTRKTLNVNREKRSDLSMAIQSGKSKLQSLQSRLEFYSELVEQKEGYSEGVRTVLDAPNVYPGIIGTVGDLFQIDEQYNMAFQSALGDWSKCLVAEDRKAALEVVSTARTKKIGNLSILPLKELEKLSSGLSKAPMGEGIIGRGTDLCGAEKKYKSLASVLLGNVILVDDLNKALDNHNLDDWDGVDLNGAYSGRNYVLKYRGQDIEGSILGRQKKIDSLFQAIEKLTSILTDQENDLSKLDKTIDNQSYQSKSLSVKLDKIYRELNEVETTLIRNHYNQSQALESLKGFQEEVKDNHNTIDDLQASAKTLKPALAKVGLEIKKLKEEVLKASDAQVRVQAERDTFQQEVQKLRIELLNLENKRDNLNFQKRVAQDTIQELVVRKKAISDEISKLEYQRKLLAQQISDAEKELQTINGQLAKEKSILNLKQSAANDTYLSMEKIQDQIRSEQQTREALLEEMKTNELKIAEMEQRINIIRERIRDRYGMEVPTDLIVDEELDDLELRIESIQRSIEKIGPINMAVQIEYEEEKDRLQMLIEQRDDLLASEDNLRETIQQIDKVARKKFQETFDQIKLNFSNLFELIFEGGSASLSLIGDPDPLESDIVIHAQPPGKKNQSLRMLSTGEKSLTAIALLFAIYQYKPSPYCILDEVDAPLDDVNIQKFKRVLNKFAGDTQFIVVTHNKLTMEAADYLYGVTMEQKGVSKLVSVKFNGQI